LKLRSSASEIIVVGVSWGTVLLIVVEDELSKVAVKQVLSKKHSGTSNASSVTPAIDEQKRKSNDAVSRIVCILGIINHPIFG
jgi:hypothetical protein